MLAALALLAAHPWTLVCGGDIMLNGIRPGSAPLSGVAQIFQKADVAYANLEIPLTRGGHPTSRKTREDLRLRNQFILRADPSHIKSIAQLGLEFVSLGNNHAMDYGRDGFQEMRTQLQESEIGFAGAGMNLIQAARPAITTIPSGHKVAMISYLAFMSTGGLSKCTPAGLRAPGVATLDFGGQVDKEAKATISSIVHGVKSKCDVLIVALHWGIERQTKPTPYQIALGRAFIDAGADAVLGSHPHVLQGGEIYRSKPILYSMGNLISPLSAQTSIFRLKWNGAKFLGIEVVPCKIAGGDVTPLEGTPATQAQARFASLCRQIPGAKPLVAN